MDEEKIAISNFLNHRDHIGCYDLERSDHTDDRFNIRGIDLFSRRDIDLCDDSLYYMLSNRYLYEISKCESIIPYLGDEVDIGMF